MKPVLQSEKKLPVSVKSGFILSFLALILTAIIGIEIAGDKKKNNLPFIYSKSVIPPVFLDSGGFYDKEFHLVLKPGSSNSKVYYTTDGTVPGRKAQIYSSPIPIKISADNANGISEIPTSPRWKPPLNKVFKGTIVRAISVTENGSVSKEVVNTYFVHSKGRDRYSLPVVSLVIDQDDFFGYNKGIYVMGKGYEDKDNYAKKNIKLNANWWDYPANYKRKGENWERPIHITFFERESNKGFSSNSGVRINGSATRAYSQKSLRIYFNEKYGQESLNYKLFPENPIEDFNQLILRNSGNDWDRTMFRDALMHSLLKNTNLDLQDYLPSIVFLNGEFWGIHNIRERFSKDYFCNKYNFAKEFVQIIDLKDGVQIRESGFGELISFVKNNDLSVKENYEHLNTLMDLENFTDYLIANIYFANTDWPNNNARCWKKLTLTPQPDAPLGQDGRWRWIFFDTDYGFGFTGNPNAYTVNMLNKLSPDNNLGLMFNALIKNQGFKEKFINRFNYHLENTFIPDKVLEKINQMEAVLKPEMQEHIQRWRKPTSMKQWIQNVQVLKEFAINRPNFQKEQLEDFLKENNKK